MNREQADESPYWRLSTVYTSTNLPWTIFLLISPRKCPTESIIMQPNNSSTFFFSKNKQTIFIHREANRCRHGLSKNCNEILSHIYRGAKCCEPARDSHEKRDERAKWLNMRWVRKLHSFFKNVAVGSGRKAAGNRRRSARKERKIGDDDMKTWECWSLWLFLVSLTFQTFFLYI